MKRIAGTLIGLLVASAALAQDVNLDDIPEAERGKQKVEAVDPNPHPEISHDSSWATGVVIVIAGMFVAAMFCGMFVKMPVPAADPHGHDDHSHGGHGHDDHGHGDQSHGDHGAAAHGH